MMAPKRNHISCQSNWWKFSERKISFHAININKLRPKTLRSTFIRNNNNNNKINCDQKTVYGNNAIQRFIVFFFFFFSSFSYILYCKIIHVKRIFNSSYISSMFKMKKKIIYCRLLLIKCKQNIVTRTRLHFCGGKFAEVSRWKSPNKFKLTSISCLLSMKWAFISEH